MVNYTPVQNYNSTYENSNVQEEDSSYSKYTSDKSKTVGYTTSVKLLSDAFLNEEDEELPLTTNPFKDPELASFYRTLYEESNYECKHIFDPDLEWSNREEVRVVKKLDKTIALFACIMFVGLQIDRGNLQQAISDNMLDDLKLTTNDYNTGNSIFLACFLLGELPSSVISKWIGPERFIPFQMISWSFIAASQCLLTGKMSFFITRALIAFLQSGLVPELVLWLSTYYKSNELPIRLSWFWTTLSLAQIGSSILSLGTLRLRGFLGWEGWRWLFLIEGTITLFIGFASIFMLIPSPIETKSVICPEGWFNGHEIKIIVNRILRDDPTKGDTNNKQGVSLRQLCDVIMDYDLWPIYLIGLVAYIPINTVTSYMALTLKNLGWSTHKVNLLSIPYNLLHIFFLLKITKLSEILNQRALVSLLVPIYLVPLLAILSYWKGSMSTPICTSILLTFIAGAPYVHAICVGWVSAQSASIKSRSVSAAIYNLTVQGSGIIAANIYRKEDAPLYKKGNQLLFWIAFAMFPLLLLVKGYYSWRNKVKERKWNSMTLNEQHWYVKNTADKGNKRLDFRFLS